MHYVFNVIPKDQLQNTLINFFFILLNFLDLSLFLFLYLLHSLHFSRLLNCKFLLLLPIFDDIEQILVHFLMLMDIIRVIDDQILLQIELRSVHD